MAYNSTSWSIQGNTKAGATSSTTDALTTGALTVSGAGQFSNTLTVGVDDTGYDVKFFGATTGQYMLWDESADELVLAGDSKLSFHDAAGGENIIATSNGHLEINAGTTLDITAPTVDINAATELNIDGNVDLNGTLDVSSTTQLNNTLTVGVDDTGYDVKFFGDTASNYMLWDTSSDRLEIHTTGNAAGITLHTTDTDASHGPNITLRRDVAGADNDSIGTLDFYGQDDNGNSTLYGRIYSQIITAGDGNELGSLQLKAMTEQASGNGIRTGIWIKGSSTNDEVTVTMPNGGLTIGKDTETRGSLKLYDGAGGNTPGYLVLYSPNGTANYIFCEDDGTLKRHTSIPTANANGSEIGGQS
jgi:hypothetical protein